MSSPTTRTAVSQPSSYKRSDVPREFFVSVELYLSPKAASGLRKVGMVVLSSSDTLTHHLCLALFVTQEARETRVH